MRWVLAILICLTSGAAFAYHLQSFLLTGDEALLAPPTTTFSLELARMKLDPPRFHAVPPTNGYAAQSTGADLADLGAALRKSGMAAAERERVLEDYGKARATLDEFIQAVDQWRSESGKWVDGHIVESAEGRPHLDYLDIPAEAPPEFADYLRACLAYRNARTNDARETWKAILERPARERHYRSAWAAYMLGITADDDKPEEAIKYFALTRKLATGGFADTLGLAAASIGREAKVDLEQHHFEQAIELYLEQYAGGDASVVASLHFSAAYAVTNGVPALIPLAKNPRTQKVVTAYITSGLVSANESQELARARVRDWLVAVAKSGTRIEQFADEYALASYQTGDFELAGRWAELAHHSPAAEWIQAKLLLRSGKTREAESMLSRLIESFPLKPLDTNELGSLTFSQCLTMNRDYWGAEKPSAACQIRGELGILRLANGEYLQSLDDLLRADWLVDADYVAERVLTIEELKSYVDANWPDLGVPNEGAPDPDAGPRENIRALLGRRLCRLNRGVEAGGYFQASIQPIHAELMRQLTEAWDESRPAAIRAESFFAAAQIVEDNGYSLLGTALAPDDECLSYSQGEDMAPQFRSTNELTVLMRPTADETQRYNAHKPDPDLRGHFRYQAASLAWEASKLMPDNSDATAYVLWTAGSWLKYRDPHFADLFYKTLVRRCRKTALGAGADDMRWFPRLDAAGNIVPHPVRARPAPAEAVPNQADPVPENEPSPDALAPPQ